MFKGDLREMGHLPPAKLGYREIYSRLLVMLSRVLFYFRILGRNHPSSQIPPLTHKQE